MRALITAPIVGYFLYLASRTFALANENHRYEQSAISCVVEEIIFENDIVNDDVPKETAGPIFQCILNADDRSGINRITAELIVDENERDVFRSKPGSIKRLHVFGSSAGKLKADDYVIDLTKLHGSGEEGGNGSIDEISRNGYEVEEIVDKNTRMDSEGHLLNLKSPRSVLVIRGSLPENEFPESPEVISNRVFGGNDDRVNLRSQYLACSWGKLEFVPATGENIIDGVIDIHVEYDEVVEPSARQLTDILTAKSSNMTGSDIFEIYDHIMFMLPPGLMVNIANSVLLGKKSLYDGKWGMSVMSQMHEIGHNLGLHHSGYDGRKYGDITGQMGYASTSNHEKMSKCFNAPQTWFLDFMEDRLKQVDPFDYSSSNPWEGRLISMSDYKSDLQENDSVVIRIVNDADRTKDLYFMYNKKEGFNYETEMFKNKVVVTESQEAAMTWVQDGLRKRQEYRIRSWNETADTTLVARVADIESEGKLDFAVIQIFISKQKSSNTNPHLAPSLSPSSSRSPSFRPGSNSDLLGRLKGVMAFATESLCTMLS